MTPPIFAFRLKVSPEPTSAQRLPDMTGTELPFARLLGATRRHVELVLALPPSYRSGHEATGLHAPWGETSLPRRLDGLIVTGAPLELPLMALARADEAIEIGCALLGWGD